MPFMDSKKWQAIAPLITETGIQLVVIQTHTPVAMISYTVSGKHWLGQSLSRNVSETTSDKNCIHIMAHSGNQVILYALTLVMANTGTQDMVDASLSGHSEQKINWWQPRWELTTRILYSWLRFVDMYMPVHGVEVCQPVYASTLSRWVDLYTLLHCFEVRRPVYTGTLC